MKAWEQVAEVVMAGGVGIVAEKLITLPLSSGNAFTDGILDILLGLGVAFVSFKYIDSQEIGTAGAAAGLGWAFSAGANMVGVQI